MRTFLVTSLVGALAALAAVSPAAAQSDPRAFQAVCEAQGGTFMENFYGARGNFCISNDFRSYTARERQIQETVCERAQGGTFIEIFPSVTLCLVV